MASPSNFHRSHFVEGLKISRVFSAEVVRSAINLKPRDDDIFIVTYPRSGTTWSHYTLKLILRHGEPFGDDFNFLRSCPHVELTSVEEMEAMPCPRTFKMHLPAHLAPWSDKAKYIHVARNPKDTCVSYFHFHHHKNMAMQFFTGDFDEFFEHFLSGDLDFGDYFDHLQGWYERRNEPNVLFLTYEEIKENPEAAILKMASFIDEEKYAEPLRKDRQKLENVVKYSSFEEMQIVNKSVFEVFSLSSEEVKKSEIPEGVKEMVLKTHKNRQETRNVNFANKSSHFIRKGVIGDWRNHFSEEQSRRMDEKFAERTKNMEIAKFWKKYM